ncbi:hypothetical protein GCM10010218_52400 [Streptomyces mashuensis]|uniref:Secreted protein n=1 Tax=Streptomyces mashuensis TaxID=33904 RepID=A0A919EFN3_9ACTN|nr:hypothetical protein [Streptomyces mashuensis]GHF64377.1 hypothetical protein GCM10010218_52400 [Streptomyces mashuensis]
MNKLQRTALALAATTAALTAAVAPAAASPGPGVLSATGCHGTTCIYVNGSGLRVNYAVVTNKKGSTVGRGMISSNWDGRTHTGPRLKKGQSWRFDYNRIMNNGNKVCGSIEGIDVACVTIHR